MSWQTITSTSNRNNTPLTLDQVRSLAPSAFATTKHESRSDKYAIIPTSKVIEGLIGQGFLPYRAQQGKSRIEGKEFFTKHMIRFRQRDAMLSMVGDAVPEVVLVNSHDGTSAYKLFAGIFRLVCSNGLVVADGMVGSVSVQHKGNVVDKVIDGSFRIIDDSRKALTAAKEWSAIRLSDAEQTFFANGAHALRFGDDEGNTTTPIQPTQLLRSRRYADDGNDLWKTFNRVQENMLQGGLRGWKVQNGIQNQRVTTRRISSIDQDVKLNRALWTLAEAMAAHKKEQVA